MSMDKDLEELADDLKAQWKYEIPPEHVLDDLDKYLKCTLVHGGRIWWYFVDDLNLAKREGLDHRECAPFSGIVIAAPGVELNSRGELDIEMAVVIVDKYPTEKCSPEVAWLAMGRLLSLPDLVEVFNDADKAPTKAPQVELEPISKSKLSEEESRRLDKRLALRDRLVEGFGDLRKVVDDLQDVLVAVTIGDDWAP
jgi:hypothetical protein